jgi:hypothetical protein
MPRRLVLILTVAAALLTTMLASPVWAGAPPDFDLEITDLPDPVAAGTNVTYTISLSSIDGVAAPGAELSTSTPAGTTFVSFAAPAGWTATTPPVGGTGPITAHGAATIDLTPTVFTLTVQVGSGVAAGTVLTLTAGVCCDTTPDNNTETETTLVAAAAATPVASNLPNAAMDRSADASPLLALGFSVLLIGSLGTLAFARTRRR